MLRSINDSLRFGWMGGALVVVPAERACEATSAVILRCALFLAHLKDDGSDVVPACAGTTLEMPQFKLVLNS
jgi:hypothetical protein